MVNSAGPEPALGDLEASSRPEDNVLFGHTDIFQADVHVTVRRAVTGQYVHGTHNLDTRCVHRDQNL